MFRPPVLPPNANIFKLNYTGAVLTFIPALQPQITPVLRGQLFPSLYTFHWTKILLYARTLATKMKEKYWELQKYRYLTFQRECTSAKKQVWFGSNYLAHIWLLPGLQSRLSPVFTIPGPTDKCRYSEVLLAEQMTESDWHKITFNSKLLQCLHSRSAAGEAVDSQTCAITAVCL